MKKILIITSVLFLASCVNNNNKDELPTPQAETSTFSGPVVTYTSHTKTYFDNYCIACHAVGQTQSFWPLTTYAEVSSFSGPGGKIQTRVIDFGNMPPSGSGSGFLTAAEKDTLQMWIDQGAPQ